MKKLGIITQQIANDQKHISIIKSLNTISEKERGLDCILFYADMGLMQEPNYFALMSIIETLDYDGILIATDIMSGLLLQNCLMAKKKYFYIWDLEWYHTSRTSSFIQQLYTSDEVELIVRSEDHAKIVERIFKKPKHIIEEFNHEQIEKLIYS